MIENSKVRRLKRYRRIIELKRRILTKQDIELAMKNTKSNAAAARYLGVNYLTYRKYARQFTNEEGKSLFELHLNQFGKGITKLPFDIKRKIAPLDDILAGKYQDYNPNTLKTQLISEGYLPEKCAECGFCEKRIFDYKIPLLLNFIDNNKNNYELLNLELLCYNCYFLYVGNPLDINRVYKIPRITISKDMDNDTRFVNEI